MSNRTRMVSLIMHKLANICTIGAAAAMEKDAMQYDYDKVKCHVSATAAMDGEMETSSWPLHSCTGTPRLHVRFAKLLYTLALIYYAVSSATTARTRAACAYVLTCPFARPFVFSQVHTATTGQLVCSVK